MTVFFAPAVLFALSVSLIPIALVTSVVVVAIVTFVIVVAIVASAVVFVFVTVLTLITFALASQSPYVAVIPRAFIAALVCAFFWALTFGILTVFPTFFVLAHARFDVSIFLAV